MRLIFVVIEQAVYRHRVVGASTSFEVASKIAEEESKQGKKDEWSYLSPADGHHTYDVLELEAGKRVGDGSVRASYRSGKRIS